MSPQLFLKEEKVSVFSAQVHQSSGSPQMDDVYIPLGSYVLPFSGEREIKRLESASLL